MNISNVAPQSIRTKKGPQKCRSHNNRKCHSKKNEKIHYLWAPLIVGIGLLINYMVSMNFLKLPTAVFWNQTNSENDFVSEKAQNKLRDFVRIGSRIVGSQANDYFAVRSLEHHIKKIQITSKNIIKLEYEIQKASGCFSFDEMVRCYENITNFIVKLTPNVIKSNSSLLVNSHFDSVDASPGAGDAGTMIVVMLEIIRVLTHIDYSFKHSVVFLFNGASESGLQGAHAFITQHKWANDIKAFLNLDSAGNGGKELLFHADRRYSWLIKHYQSSAKHPFATCFAQDIYDSNFIPSVTDLKIFEYFKGIPGLDFAHVYNGYVYHTKYDSFTTIPIGTIQHTGDNILALVRSLINSTKLDQPFSAGETDMVYFDLLGWFLISYTGQQAIILNVFLCILTLICIAVSLKQMTNASNLHIKTILIKFLITIIVQIVTHGLAVGLPLITAVIIDASDISLAWFTEKWLIFGLYYCPMYFGLGIVPSYYIEFNKKNSLPLNLKIHLFLHAQCVLHIITVLVLTALSIRSAYIFVMTIIFYTVSLVFNILFKFQNTHLKWIPGHLIGQIIPFIYYSYLSQLAFTSLIPITGRMGSLHNPELLISSLSVFFGILIGGFVMPIFNVCRKTKTLISGLLIITAICLIVSVTSIGFPYRAVTSPQRFEIMHVKRMFYNSDYSLRRNESGYFLIPLDRHSPYSVANLVVNMTMARSTREDCVTEVFCGLPIPMYANPNLSYWIPADSPYVKETPTLNRTGMETLENNKCRHNFVMTGPNHSNIYISPLNNAELINWSFASPIQKVKTFWKNTYYIDFIYGAPNNFTRFYLDFKQPCNSNKPTFDIALVGHFKAYRYRYTGEFQQFLKSFPSWTSIASWVSSFMSWKY